MLNSKKITFSIVGVLAATLVTTVFAAIGSIETSFTPAPSGNGRAVAFDGTDLYYTITSSTAIYKVSTGNVALGTIVTAVDDDADGVADEDPVDLADNDGDLLIDEDAFEGGILCGALDWDPSTNLLWCGSYDGSTRVFTVNPLTGVMTSKFDETAFGGIAADSCYGPGPENSIDGLALDSDGSVWLSGDAAKTVYHVTAAGALLGSFTAPDHPSTGTTGCNTGIEVVGNYLELAMQTGPDAGPHDIVKVAKLDNVNNPPIIVSFTALASNNPGVEDIAYDSNTYAPRCVLWTNQFGAENALTAYDVQCTHTIGYWKNHSDDAEEFLPLSLGDGTDDNACDVIDTAAEVEGVLKGANSKEAVKQLKAQLLAAKLNVAMGDIPPADLAAIAVVIADADELISRDTGGPNCTPDTGKKGVDRAEATALISALDAFNNMYTP